MAFATAALVSCGDGPNNAGSPTGRDDDETRLLYDFELNALLREDYLKMGRVVKISGARID